MQIKTQVVSRLSVSVSLWLFFIFALVSHALAVPETVGVKITDVTTSSFSVVWMTDVAAEPMVEVYSDSSMTNQITELVTTPMPASSTTVVEAARNKGIMKIRVSGLSPSTAYYVRTLTGDPENPQSIGYSALYEVITASEVTPYYYSGDTAQGFSNDLVAFTVYIRPLDKDTEPEPGAGDLIILEDEVSPYPISAFAGDGINSPQGILDMNNLFNIDGLSRDVTGGEKIVLRVYRAGTLSTLIHYRRIPQDEGMVYVAEPVRGFFADINLDGNVDDEDFEEIRKQYRALPDDADYNPDFDFVDDEEGKIDVREFSKFTREYGRTDVE